MKYPHIVVDYDGSPYVCINEHSACEIVTYQNMMTVPIKTVLQIVSHVVHHQMCDAIIVVVIAQWSGIVYSNCQLGKASRQHFMGTAWSMAADLMGNALWVSFHASRTMEAMYLL